MNKTLTIAVTALTALALCLRLVGLGENAFHQDESALLMQALGGESHSLDPPVPVWGTAAWIWIWGNDSNLTLRLLPALLGALALWPLVHAARGMVVPGRRSWWASSTPPAPTPCGSAGWRGPTAFCFSPWRSFG